MYTTVILAQLRGKWGPSGGDLRRLVGLASGLRRAGIGPESGSAEIDSFYIGNLARGTPLFRSKIGK